MLHGDKGDPSPLSGSTCHNFGTVQSANRRAASGGSWRQRKKSEKKRKERHQVNANPMNRQGVVLGKKGRRATE